MSGDLGSRSGKLLDSTRLLYEALERDDLPADGPEMSEWVARQQEAFNDFSRTCDPSVPLDEATRRDIDQVLRLEERMIERANKVRGVLLEQRRKVASRLGQAQAFQSKAQEPPRFVTRRV